MSRLGLHPIIARGFTLLELLVVLTITTLTLTLVAARFDLWGRGVAVETGAWRLASVMRRAHGRAALDGRTVEVHIDPQRGRYWSSARARGYSLTGGLLVEALDPPDAARPGGELVVAFYPSGTASGIELRISDRKRAYLVAVSGLTGRVSVRRDDLGEGERR